MDYTLMFLIVAVYILCWFFGFKYGQVTTNRRWKNAVEGKLKEKSIPKDLEDSRKRFLYKNEINEISFSLKKDASDVLEMLLDTIEAYNCVTIADLYEFIGRTPNYVDNLWGWYNLGDARVRARTSKPKDGFPLKKSYIIDLPEPVELK